MQYDAKRAKWRNVKKEKPPVVMTILVKLQDGRVSYGAIDSIKNELKLLLSHDRYRKCFDPSLIFDISEIKQWAFLP